MARTGRPLELDRIIDRVPLHDEHGNPTGDYQDITVGEAFLASVARGFFPDRAAGAVGIPVQTFRRWEREAAQARATLAAGGQITRNARALVDFCSDVDRLEQAWEDREWSKIEEASIGAVTTTTTTKFDKDGNRLETTVVEKRAPGNLTASIWRLRQRFPNTYRETLAALGNVGGFVETTASEGDRLNDEISAFLAGVDAGSKVRGNGNGSHPGG